MLISSFILLGHNDRDWAMLLSLIVYRQNICFSLSNVQIAYRCSKSPIQLSISFKTEKSKVYPQKDALHHSIGC